MKQNNKVLIILCIILGIVVLGLGGYIVYDKFIANVDNQEDKQENKEKSEYEKFVEEEKAKRTGRILYEHSNNEDEYSKIEMTASGEIVVNADFINNSTVETKVLKAFEARFAMSDICMGNTSFVFIKEDGTLSALSLDSFECGKRIDLKTNLGNLKNIVEVYTQEDHPATEFEPPAYSTYAKDIDGKVININQYLERLPANDSKEYILDSSKVEQEFMLQWFGESTEYGYIKLDNKEYKVSFVKDSTQAKLKIGEKEFDYEPQPGDKLYLISNYILVVHEGSDAWISVLDSNLNVKLEEKDIIISGYCNSINDFINWEQKVITYYRINNMDKTKVDVYNFNFITNEVSNPKLIKTIENPFETDGAQCA